MQPADQPKRPAAVYLLIVVLLLQSITALICGALMVLDPSGTSLQLPIVVLKGAPFSTFLIPGIFLFSCLGLLPLLAIYALLSKRGNDPFRAVNFYPEFRSGFMLSLFCGFATVIWITVQLHFTQTYHWLQTVYDSVGLVILILALLPATMRYCRIRPN